MREKKSAAPGGGAPVVHSIPPVWSAESRVLILGSMPSPKSRSAGFFYMHPRNRFWRVISAALGETLSLPNDAPDLSAAIAERKALLLRHRVALWDVLASCTVTGAADASIRDAVPNDFSKLLARSEIRRVLCTGKAAFGLWKKLCAAEYEERFGVESRLLPSTSPANAAWTEERLAREYAAVGELRP